MIFMHAASFDYRSRVLKNVMTAHYLGITAILP